MNHEQWMQLLENRLQQWAEWSSQDNFCGLGYPPCTMEYKIMHEGSVARSTHHRKIITHTAAEEIEALVNEMSQYHPTMAAILRSYYFSQGSLREKAKILQLSHSHYKHYVDLAHQWLVGRLSGNKKSKNNKKNGCNVKTNRL